jgi:hypothetical protein
LPIDSGDAVETFEFGSRFDVEAENADVQRQLHLARGLADARENDLSRVGSGVQYAPEFALGDNVEAGATAREEVQDGEVGIGLDGIADEPIEAGQFALEFVQRRLDGVPGINPARRAELGGDVGQ